MRNDSRRGGRRTEEDVVSDAIFVVVAVVWMVLSALSGDGAAFITWFAVLVYSGINLGENMLRRRGRYE